jgi:Tol biopolymer transport system component
MSLAPGTHLGVYEILAAIGVGGMGEVYRATDTKLKRQVAIKILPSAFAVDADRLARFRREAEVLASLNHPNVAAIHGFEDADGIHALVMELVEGPTLEERIASGPIPTDEALTIARQIADALGAAHDQGIVHRDLKPANIKLRPDGTVKVLDFGLAKAMESGGSGAAGSVTQSPTLTSPAFTQVGMLLGTAAYMSPEQASGKAVDKRADIWAFGVVLWEMVTGRRMFDGETVSHVLAAVLTQAPDLAAAPPRVRRLLERCLEKDPRKRLRDIGDAMSLAEEINAETGAGPRESPRRRSSAVLAWIVAAALAVGLGLAIWSRRAAPADTAARPPVRLQIDRASIDPYNNAASAFAVSPDGRFLAYYTASNGRATLSVQTLATGERREVPGSTVVSPQFLFWSDDSRHVVYATILNASVFDVVTATTRELCVCRFRGGSWSRDGVILLGSSPADAQPIRRVSLDDRTPVPVTTVESANGEQDTLPIFLPDGHFIFTRTRPGRTTATYLATLKGETRRITDGSRSLLATLPDGTHVLLGIDAAGLVAQTLNLDTAALGQPIIVVPGAAAASVSNNGVLATSMPAARPNRIPTWFDRKGVELARIGSAGPIQTVALAPDGRTVAVGTAGGNAATALWLRDPAGADRRLDPEGGDAPVWSPDGKRILVSVRKDGVVNLFERAADGSGRQTQLFAAERNAYGNDWSRDGRWIIYTMGKDGALSDLDLWVVRADDGAERKPVPYLTSPAREAQAEFSPDGRFVAYTAMRNEDPEVYVQPFPNASDGKWLVSTGGGTEPHWSRDGKELFYFAGQTLMAVPVKLEPSFSSGQPVRLFDANITPWFTNDGDRSHVSPDGLRFLLLPPAGAQAASPIDITVNWTSLLEKRP